MKLRISSAEIERIQPRWKKPVPQRTEPNDLSALLAKKIQIVLIVERESVIRWNTDSHAFGHSRAFYPGNSRLIQIQPTMQLNQTIKIEIFLRKRSQRIDCSIIFYRSFSRSLQAEMPLGNCNSRITWQPTKNPCLARGLNRRAQHLVVSLCCNAIQDHSCKPQLWVEHLKAEHHRRDAPGSLCCVDDEHDRQLQQFGNLRCASSLRVPALSVEQSHHAFSDENIRPSCGILQNTPIRLFAQHPCIKISSFSPAYPRMVTSV